MQDENVKQNIVEAAMKLFQMYGYNRISVDEIAASLRISKKTIYQHFASKEELLLAAVSAIVDPALGKVNGLLDMKLGFEETFARLASIFHELSAQMTPQILQDLHAMPRLWKKIDERRNEVISRYVEVIERGQELGEVRKDVDSRFLITLITTVVRHFAIPANLLALNMSPKQMAGNILSIIMFGILTDQGREKLLLSKEGGHE